MSVIGDFASADRTGRVALPGDVDHDAAGGAVRP
jgi:hypothetical protein